MSLLRGGDEKWFLKPSRLPKHPSFFCQPQPNDSLASTHCHQCREIQGAVFFQPLVPLLSVFLFLDTCWQWKQGSNCLHKKRWEGESYIQRVWKETSCFPEKRAQRVAGVKQSDVAELTVGPLQLSGKIQLGLSKIHIYVPHTSAKIRPIFSLFTHKKLYSTMCSVRLDLLECIFKAC